MNKAKLSLLFIMLICGQSCFAQSEKTGTKPESTGSSVQDFFQTGSLQRDNKDVSSDKKGERLVLRFYNCLWHVLDNAGVPMFTGRSSDIDPSNRATTAIASPKLNGHGSPVNKEDSKGDTATNQVPAPQAAQHSDAPPPKIPESELEGTIYDLPSKQDVQNPAP
jgi:hypothetical protein